MSLAPNQRLSITVAFALLLMGGSYLTSRANQPLVDVPLFQHRGRTGETSPKGGTRIILDHADLLSYDAQLRPGIQLLRGNVRLRHGNAVMTCDSAYLNEEEQRFEAFGEVHMVQGDTVHMYARYLHYDGFTRLARLRENVHLANKTTDLYTDSLDYDRIADIAYYFEGGTITDAKNTLTSDYGQFLPATNDAEFRYHVKLVNDRTTMTTEHLFYNTHTQVSSYEGETLIQSDSGRIESTRGIYDVGNEVGILLERSQVFSGARSLLGDSIYYDGLKQSGEAFGRMVLTDTAQKATLYGDYGYFDNPRNYAFATSRAHAQEYSQQDTLYIAADTLELISRPIRDQVRLASLRSDTTSRSRPDTMQRYLRAYKHVRVFRRDAQAVADSMSYISTDSLLALYGSPIMWNEHRQLSGDTTLFFFRQHKLDYVDVLGSSLAIEHLDSVDYYNQLSSSRLRAYLQDSTVRELYLEGGVESIYYMKEEDSNDYTGLNRMTSATMRVLLDSGKVEKSIWTGPVEGKAYPIEMAETEDVNRLKNFHWASHLRPLRKEDITQASDSLSNESIQPSRLAELRRFSGAPAALRAYAPFLIADSLTAVRTDSLLQQYHQHPYEEYSKTYKFVLRLTSSQESESSSSSSLLDLSWVYNPFSSKEDHDSSSISPSIGIPRKKN